MLIVKLTDEDRKASKFFTENVLGQDGVFVFRLIALNAGQLVASQVLESLWTRYRKAIGGQHHNTTHKGSRDSQQSPPTYQPVIPPLPVRLKTPKPKSEGGAKRRTLATAADPEQLSWHSLLSGRERANDEQSILPARPKERHRIYHGASSSDRMSDQFSPVSTDSEINLLRYSESMI